MKTFQEALNMFAQGLGNDLRNELVMTAPVNDGRLKTNISYSVNNKNINFTMMPYALYVEFGTGGQRKGQTSTVGGRTTIIPSKPGRKMPVKKSGDEWISFVEEWGEKKLGKGSGFALAKHIQLYGTRPHPFIRPVFYTKIVDLIKSNWNRHMQDIELKTIGGS